MHYRRLYSIPYSIIRENYVNISETLHILYYIIILLYYIIILYYIILYYIILYYIILYYIILYYIILYYIIQTLTNISFHSPHLEYYLTSYENCSEDLPTKEKPLLPVVHFSGETIKSGRREKGLCKHTGLTETP